MIGALFGAGALIATAKITQRVIKNQDHDSYDSYYSDEFETWRGRLKIWLFELLGLEMNEYHEWRPTFRTVGIAVFGPLFISFFLSLVLNFFLPVQRFEVTLSPVRIWVTGEATPQPKANITVVASGNAVERDGIQLEYIVTDAVTGKIITTGTFEQRLYVDIGFDRGPAGARYRVDVTLIRPGHDPWSNSRVFDIPSATALPNS
jgi:hypothetical protein